MTQFVCSLPWTGFSNEPNGKAQPCCLYKGYITDEQGNPMYVQQYNVNEILKSKFMKNLRQKFREGKKPIGCSTCWTDEDNGYDSKRIVYNTKINHDPIIDFNAEPEYCSEFQLIINNSCNLKCRSCTPSHSTQWQAEIKALTGDTGYHMPFYQSGDELGKLWTDRFIWYETLRRLEVVGGEPFYVKQWHTIFNELIDNGFSKNIDITLTTNCTLFYPNLVERLANNFKSVSIGLSIDGINSVYEYIRHPGNWKTTYENIKKYYTFVNRINLQFNITISWLNVLQLPELHTLVKTEFPKISIWNNIVHFPLHLSIYSIPDNMKEDIREIFSKYDWAEHKNSIESILNFMDSKTISINTWKENLEIIYKTDNFRNEKLYESIPYLKKYLN